MNVDKDTITKIAHLARLEFDDAHVDSMKKDLTTILDWVDHLNEVNTDGVEPLTHMSYETNIFREDEVKDELSHERGFKNAPQQDADYFRVPKVIE